MQIILKFEAQCPSVSFCGNTAMPVCSRVFGGCFPAPGAQMSDVAGTVWGVLVTSHCAWNNATRSHTVIAQQHVECYTYRHTVALRKNYQCVSFMSKREKKRKVDCARHALQHVKNADRAIIKLHGRTSRLPRSQQPH